MRTTTASLILTALLTIPAASLAQAAGSGSNDQRALPEGASSTGAATRVDESKAPEPAGPGRRTIDTTGKPEPTEPMVHDRNKPNPPPSVAK